MKKILFTILIVLINIKIFALEKITINNDNLIPIFEKDLKKYNYFTSSDKVLISVKKSENEIINGDGLFEVKDGENEFIIISNIDGEYIINVYKNYQKKELEFGKLKSLRIDGYDIDFDSDKYEYDIVINNEDMLNINYELLNDSSYVDVKGNGNFNKETNLIVINVDDINTYKIKVHKTIDVIKNISEEDNEIKEMSYAKKEIVKLIIITISCIIVFSMFYILFLHKKKSILHV